jgi:hypothetical protein
MSLVLADRVRQTSTSTGTGTITLDGTVVGYQSFSAIGNNNTTYYTISLGAQWEVGIGTYYGGTLSRDTVIASSTGSILNLAAGTKDVFVSLPAEKLVQSVNSQIGAVVLTTTNIAEGANEYFTQSRARTSISAGTGISYDSGTGVITNSSPSLGGDVVGPSSATDNAIARFDGTTGKLIQNSVVTAGDTGAVSGVTTLAASTSVTTPIVQATNSGGLSLKNSAGTTQISMGGGGGDNVTISVPTNINGSNAQIDISPTGTGHVHIKPTGTGAVEIAPTNVGTMDNMTIGATTARNASVVDLSVTGTLSFDAAQGTAGQVLTSAGTSATPTWTTPTTGTVTSVTGTSPVASSGGATPAISLSSGYGDTQNPYASKTANYFLAAPNGSAGAPTFRAVVAADIPTLNQNTTGTASNVTGTVAIANGGTGATDATNARSNLSAAKSGANTDITSIALTTGTISTAPSGGTDIVNKTYADGLAAKWGT